MQSYLAPPIFVVFFGGVFFKRLNAAGCLAALLVGFGLGLWRLAVDTPVSLQWEGYQDGYAPGSLNYIINNMYFQYFSLLIFLVSTAVMVLASYATRAPSEERISRFNVRHAHRGATARVAEQLVGDRCDRILRGLGRDRRSLRLLPRMIESYATIATRPL